MAEQKLLVPCKGNGGTMLPHRWGIVLDYCERWTPDDPKSFRAVLSTAFKFGVIHDWGRHYYECGDDKVPRGGENVDVETQQRVVAYITQEIESRRT